MAAIAPWVSKCPLAVESLVPTPSIVYLPLSKPSSPFSLLPPGSLSRLTALPSLSLGFSNWGLWLWIILSWRWLNFSLPAPPSLLIKTAGNRPGIYILTSSPGDWPTLKFLTFLYPYVFIPRCRALGTLDKSYLQVHHLFDHNHTIAHAIFLSLGCLKNSYPSFKTHLQHCPAFPLRRLPSPGSLSTLPSMVPS